MPKARALLVALLAVGGLPAAAQPVTLEPSAVSRCLSPARAERGEPEYPFAAWKENRGAHLKVELTFHAPDRAPEIKILEDAQDPAFADEIRSYAKRLRVPCLTAAETPARLIQDYVFQPEERFVRQGLPADPRDLERLNMIGCITHVRGARGPDYPRDVRQAGVQGRLYVRMLFTAPNAPPQVTVFGRPETGPLVDSLESWAQGYRMPCHQGGVVSSGKIFIYRFEGDEPYGFKPLRLQQFMGSVRNVALQRLNFDTTRMGCPFDLQLTYGQPLLPNTVREAGPPNPARAPLIEWLRGAELDLPSRSLAAVFLDSTVITVPCLKIDLKPKE
jgi:hypothetical protein